MLKQKFNYGWVIAFVCTIMSFMVLGLGNSPLSLYIVPVTQKLGLSRGAFSLVFTLLTISTMLIQLFYGIFVHRVGLRVMVITGSILAPLAYFVFGRASTLPAFYAGGVTLGIALALASVTSISLLVHNWFREKQGTVLGLILAASGLGGFVFSRMIGQYIALNGFQAAFSLSAILLAVAAVPVILLTRAGPGDQAAERASRGHSGKGKMSIGGFFSIPGMQVGILAVFLIGLVIHPILVNTPPYLVEKGFDAVFAARISAAVFFVMAVAKLVLGVIHDRLGIRVSMLLGLGSFVVAATLLVLATGVWTVWVYVLFNGIAVATLALLVPLFAKAILGAANYSSYLGIFIAVLSAGIAIGVPAISYAYDIVGSYSWVIGAFAVLGVLALALAMLSLNQVQKTPAAVTIQTPALR